MKVRFLDTTLRDGTQASGITLSVDDKLKIARALDDFGMHYIEGGWPGSNRTDELFFMKAKGSLRLKTAQLAAFGSTRYKGNKAHNDPNLIAIARSGAGIAAIFGKSWDLHVVHALRASLRDNLSMIGESILYLRGKGLKVIYDAEHFFDGFRANSEYALETLRVAARSGAVNITLCDTNGGSLPDMVRDAIIAVREDMKKSSLSPELGIHTHNDSDCAVASTVCAVSEGISLVQGTINGYGERCGNANLCSVIPNLQLKLGIKCVPDAKLRKLTELSRYIAEVANKLSDEHMPYVGNSAFAHKGGIHVSAMARHTSTYEHIDPEKVGNERRVLVSELAGKSNIAAKVKELRLDFARDKESTKKIFQLVKKLEHDGYQFEDADASFALTVHRALGKYRNFFDILGFRVIVERDPMTGRMRTEATIKVKVEGKEGHTVAEGDGPVNALDNALRRALDRFFPELREVSLSDFKVRVINAAQGTAAKVRVTIESHDKNERWGTVGVSENMIEASWQALVDAIEYKLLKQSKKR
jgi:2-isopropylmalate synthase